MPTFARPRNYYVYILTNAACTVLYIGVTNDIIRRMHEHKTKLIPGFTSRYNVNKLMAYFEFNDVQEAITYEKKLKGWSRDKKLKLIKEHNPQGNDLAADWLTEEQPHW